MWNAISPGFELVSPCPIPATITITPPPFPTVITVWSFVIVASTHVSLVITAVGKGVSLPAVITCFPIHWIILLKFVNWAVNVCSNLIDCFEFVPLSPTPALIYVTPAKVSSSYFGVFFSTSRRLCLVCYFCFASSCLFAFDFGQFFLKQSSLRKIGPFPYRVFIVTCWNNKPTVGYFWFWYAVSFKEC